MIREDEDVAEPSECRLIGHHPREGDLRRATVGVAVERRKADRLVDGTIHDVAGNPRRPVRLVMKEPPDQIAIDVSRVARYDALIHVARV